MKVLISAFECDPSRGSDRYVGWAFSVNMARLNEVYGLTRAENRASIGAYISAHPDPVYEHIHFYYIRRPRIFTERVDAIGGYTGFLVSYLIWQRPAYRLARKLCREEGISIVHLVSMADFRCIGSLWKCGPPFLFGPVGGGQELPEALAAYGKGHERTERFRSFVNHAAIRMPGYRKGLSRAALVFSSNDETTALLRSVMDRRRWPRLRQMTELCMNDTYLDERRMLVHEEQEVCHVLLSGRLIFRKGFELFIDAVPYIRPKKPFVADIFGKGDLEEVIREKIRKLGLEKKVVLHGEISYQQMQIQYQQSDIFVLPSLRETTGTVVMEAMANKLPVVAMKQNGVKYLVGDDVGILVDIRSKEQVLRDLGEAVARLIDDPDLRRDLGERGYKKIREQYTWSERVRQMDSVYRKLSEQYDMTTWIKGR